MTTKTTKLLSIIAIASIATIVTSVSVSNALSVCESPTCMEIQRGENTYKLRGQALTEFYDIHSRGIDFVALKEQLKFVPDNIGPIYIMLDGEKNAVNDFVSTYSVEVKTQKSTDTFVSLVGTTSKANLQKYFNTISYDQYMDSGFGIAHLGTHTDEKGVIGNGALPLTEQQKNTIGVLTDSFFDQKVDELVRTSPGVERVQ